MIRPILFAGQQPQKKIQKKPKNVNVRVNTPPQQQPATPDAGFPIKKQEEANQPENTTQQPPAETEPTEGLPINKTDKQEKTDQCPLPINKKGKKPNKKNLPDIDPDKEYSVC